MPNRTLSPGPFAAYLSPSGTRRLAPVGISRGRPADRSSGREPSETVAGADGRGRRHDPDQGDEVPDSRSSQCETALYAATNLESWETDEPNHLARDVGIAGSCFRRLDPDYYA